MDVRPVTDKQIWDSFVAEAKPSQFLQAWAWGEFQRQLGRDVVRLAVFEGDRILVGVQAIQYALPFNQNYWYVPRGSVHSDRATVAACRLLHSALVEKARSTQSLCIRKEPSFELENCPHDYESRGFLKGPTMQPADSLILDLNRTLEQIEAGLHQKTRYNIHLAERKGVNVFESTNAQSLNDFLALQSMTAQRDKIKPFPDSYFQKMYQVLVPAGQLSFWRAEYQGSLLAINLMISFGDTVSYNHGASSDEDRNVMAPHLLQWKTIEDAKRSGFAYYDFRGITPDDNPKRAWAGITRFKKGFGGRVVHYVGCYDFVLNSAWYRLYRLGQALIKIVR